MSVECSECERDARGGHDHGCSRFRKSYELQEMPYGDDDEPNVLSIRDTSYLLKRQAINIPMNEIDALIDDLVAFQQARSNDTRAFMHPVKRPYAVALVALEQAALAAEKVYIWMTGLPKKHQDSFPAGSLAVSIEAGQMLKGAPDDVAKLARRLMPKKVDGQKRKA